MLAAGQVLDQHGHVLAWQPYGLSRSAVFALTAGPVMPKTAAAIAPAKQASNVYMHNVGQVVLVSVSASARTTDVW